MHRHHPYNAGGGGGYENPGRRGATSGPGPDRAFRGPANRSRGGGGGGSNMGRNRPNYPSYDSGMSGYDSVPPSDVNGYAHAGYDTAPQDPYYQSHNYGPPAPPVQYPSQPYDQGYGGYEGALNFKIE